MGCTDVGCIAHCKADVQVGLHCWGLHWLIVAFCMSEDSCRSCSRSAKSNERAVLDSTLPDRCLGAGSTCCDCTALPDAVWEPMFTACRRCSSKAKVDLSLGLKAVFQ